MKKFTKVISTLIVIAFLGIIMLSTPSCDWLKDTLNDSTLVDNADSLAYALGWIGTDENLDEIEDDVNFGISNSGSLPASIDLSQNFPPIGNQGQYGTCVAWAVAYNHMSYMEAKELGYTQSQMANDKSKIFSPKDLFWAIDNDKKGDDCNGTGFEAAYDVLLSRGVASMNTVPYSSLGGCSHASTGGESEAQNHVISNYREIKYDKATVKGYLADSRAVVFGAKLGDEFMSANDASVLNYQSFGYTGQHAYHAMILCGYDDNKGANGAFRIVNSWGTDWGDKGYLWIDQNYFSSGDFAFCAFVAQPPTLNPDTNGDNQADNVSSGYDVVAWNLVDEDYNDPDDASNTRDRFITYNVFNAGETTLKASDDWSIFYGLSNAYDAEDNNILIYDYYSDDYGKYGEYGWIEPGTDNKMYGTTDNWWNYIDVPSGKSVASELTGTENFTFNYTLPSNITGYYYFILWADGTKKFSESNEDNNFLIFAQSNGDPIYIQNGVIASSNVFTKSMQLRKGIPVKNQATSNYPLIHKANPNTYTPKEMALKFRHGINTGSFVKKAREYASKLKFSGRKHIKNKAK